MVHLIKKEESIINKSIDPTEIVMLELDILENQPQFMIRGLGLGALACTNRKE